MATDEMSNRKELLEGLIANSSWTTLAAVASPAASIFAFSYVIGYFYAVDISWFAFFSLTEHLVFALRALPIVIGASVGFLIALRLSWVVHRLPRKWLHVWLLVGFLVWFFFLISAAVWFFLSGHVGMALVALLIAVGAIVHNLPLPPFRFETELYWGVNMIVLSFLIGTASGNAWRFQSCFPLSPDNVVVKSKGNSSEPKSNPSAPEPNSNSSAPFIGRVMFSGSSGVLICDHELKGMHFVRLDDVKAIYQCSKSKGESGLPLNLQPECSKQPRSCRDLLTSLREEIAQDVKNIFW